MPWEWGSDGPTRQLVVVNTAGEVLTTLDDGQPDPRWTSTGDGTSTEEAAFVVFNASGTKIYVSGSRGVRAFDMTSGDEIAEVNLGRVTPTSQFITPLESDDTKVVLGNTFDPLLVDIDDGTPPIALESSRSRTPIPTTWFAVGGDQVRLGRRRVHGHHRRPRRPPRSSAR